jgi:hypothetical protein
MITVRRWEWLFLASKACRENDADVLEWLLLSRLNTAEPVSPTVDIGSRVFGENFPNNLEEMLSGVNWLPTYSLLSLCIRLRKSRRIIRILLEHGADVASEPLFAYSALSIVTSSTSMLLSELISVTDLNAHGVEVVRCMSNPSLVHLSSDCLVDLLTLLMDNDWIYFEQVFCSKVELSDCSDDVMFRDLLKRVEWMLT